MIYNEEQKNVELSDQLESKAESPELVEPMLNQEQFMEKFMQEHFKQVAVGEISPAECVKFQDALNFLLALKAEVAAKRVGSLEKKDFIKSMVAKLKESGRVNIDEAEFNKTEKSVMEFVQLLDKMVAEIDADIEFYTKLLSDTPPSYVMAYKDESDNFKDYLDARMASIKKYAKNAKRDLAVSYSRYCFGFDAQIRQIAYVEQVLRHADKNAEKKNTEEA